MQIDQFRLVQVIHEGLYGPVYRGEHVQTQQPVALHVLRGAGGQPPLQALQAHVQTLQKLALLQAPTPMGCGQLSDGSLYLASQWIEGQPVASYGRLRSEGLRLVQQISASLEAAHQHGIFHGQLRPSQILVLDGREGGPRCAVLGIGLFQLLGPPAGTLRPEVLALLAPERRASASPFPLSGAADVYSLAMLIRGLLGLPQDAGSELAPAEELLGAAVRSSLVKLLVAMQASDPSQRPTMSEVNARLYGLSHIGEEQARGPGGRDQASTLDAATLGREVPAGTASPSPSRAQAADREKTVDPLIGQKFGSFRLLQRIGNGAMGSVYEARHELIGHRAAVKVLRRQLTVGKEYARRFLDEARAVNIVEHPGLVSIFEFGQRDDGLLYIVMEYLSGETLESLLNRRGSPLSPREALLVALQAARALDAAHRCGIVHRDIKPSNLMLVREPLAPDTMRVKILDFGIAKVGNPIREELSEDHTAAGVMMGTLAYMAPEQYGDAKTVDGKADVFALGMVLYEMLTLVSPFGEAATFSVMGRPAKSLSPLRTGVSAQLARKIDSMLLRDAAARPTMSEVIAALDAELRPRRRRAPLFVLGAAVLFGALTAALLHGPPDLDSEERRRSSAREQARRRLEQVLTSSREPQARALAARGIGLSRDHRYRELLVRLLADPAQEVRLAAIEALGELGNSAAEPPLTRLVTESLQSNRIDPQGRAAALALFRLQKRRLLPTAQERPERVLAQRLLKTLGAIEGGPDALAVRLRFLTARFEDPGSAEREQLRSDLLSQLDGAQLPSEERFPILKLLAAEGDRSAVERLERIARQPDRLGERIYAAALLRWLGRMEPALGAQIDALAQQQIEYQITEASLRAGLLGDMSGCGLLKRVAKDGGRGAPQRQQAAEGLGHCSFEYVAPLVPLLDEVSTPVQVQVALGSSILRVVGPQPGHGSAPDVDLAFGLSSPRVEDRLGIVDLAEALPEEDGTRLLLIGLGNSSGEVRDAAARALGARAVLRRLGLMRTALEDANADVRKAGMKAIVWLLRSFERANRTVPLSELEQIKTLARKLLAESSDDSTQAVARALLWWMGDTAQAGPLAQLMREGSEQAKLILVELLAIKDELLLQALKDRSQRVRFFAARRLAEAGRGDGVDVLRSMLGQPGEEALISYWLLRSLGVKVAPPRHLSDLLGRNQPVYTRLDVVHAIAGLPVEQALPHLVQASRDPAAVVRMAVARAAYDLFRSSREPRLLDLLNRLRSDEEPSVSTRAEALWTELLASLLKSPPSLRADMARTAAKDGGSTGSVPAPERETAAAGQRDLGTPPADAGSRVAVTRAAQPTPKPPAPASESRAPKPLPLTPEQRIQELKRMVEANKKCADPACQKSMVSLGRLLIENNNVAGGLAYLKTLWARPRGAVTADLPSRDEVHRQFRSKLWRLTIRKPQGAAGCPIVLDELYEPGGELLVSRVSPERFFPRAGQHATRDCCAPGDRQTETCTAGAAR